MTSCKGTMGAALIVLFIFLPGIAAEQTPPLSYPDTSGQQPTSKLSRHNLFMMEKRLFDLINSERRANGLSPLKSDAKIQKVARTHSRDMARRKFFGHINPDKQGVNDRLKIAKIKWTMVAENIASNKNMDDPVKAAFENWVKSSNHYKNIITPEFELSGIGVAQAQDNTFYFTQIFVMP